MKRKYINPMWTRGRRWRYGFPPTLHLFLIFRQMTQNFVTSSKIDVDIISHGRSGLTGFSVTMAANF